MILEYLTSNFEVELDHITLVFRVTKQGRCFEIFLEKWKDCLIENM